jgi:hypothetical protein
MHLFHVCIYAYMYVCIYACMNVMYVCMCVYVCMYVCMYVGQSLYVTVNALRIDMAYSAAKSQYQHTLYVCTANVTCYKRSIDW